jgi:Protein of unknown function (DUF2842)
MHIRTRKLVGTVALFVLVATWALLAMALAQTVAIPASQWVATLYYAVAGLGWVLPAMPLIWWMGRPDHRATESKGQTVPNVLSPDSESNQQRDGTG